MDEDRIRIFGIRHHGPGCARSLSLALEDWQPDCILLEGPPEGESVLSEALRVAARANPLSHQKQRTKEKKESYLNS